MGRTSDPESALGYQLLPPIEILSSAVNATDM
jgi:hypothetical protein